jgi:hypothetical protein
MHEKVESTEQQQEKREMKAGHCGSHLLSQTLRRQRLGGSRF